MNARIALLTVALAVAPPGIATAQDSLAVADEPGYGTLIAALQDAEQELIELQALGSVALADLRVASVDAILAGGDAEPIGDAFVEHQEDVEALREYLATGDLAIVADGDVQIDFEDALGQLGAGPGDVVAVDVTGGRVTLFVDPTVAEIDVEVEEDAERMEGTTG